MWFKKGGWKHFCGFVLLFLFFYNTNFMNKITVNSMIFFQLKTKKWFIACKFFFFFLQNHPTSTHPVRRRDCFVGLSIFLVAVCRPSVNCVPRFTRLTGHPRCTLTSTDGGSRIHTVKSPTRHSPSELCTEPPACVPQRIYILLRTESTPLPRRLKLSCLSLLCLTEL